MLPGFSQFQMLVPAAVLDQDGNEQWTLYAAARSIDELEAHARAQRIPRWVIMLNVCVKAAPAAPELRLVKPDA